eukprot:gene3392-3872_t
MSCNLPLIAGGLAPDASHVVLPNRSLMAGRLETGRHHGPCDAVSGAVLRSNYLDRVEHILLTTLVIFCMCGFGFQSLPPGATAYSTYHVFVWLAVAVALFALLVGLIKERGGEVRGTAQRLTSELLGSRGKSRSLITLSLEKTLEQHSGTNSAHNGHGEPVPGAGHLPNVPSHSSTARAQPTVSISQSPVISLACSPGTDNAHITTQALPDTTAYTPVT